MQLLMFYCTERGAAGSCGSVGGGEHLLTRSFMFAVALSGQLVVGHDMILVLFHLAHSVQRG